MSLSEQQLVDCTYTYDGCQGGWMGDAYDYLQSSIGSDYENAYAVNMFYGKIFFYFLKVGSPNFTPCHVSYHNLTKKMERFTTRKSRFSKCIICAPFRVLCKILII